MSGKCIYCGRHAIYYMKWKKAWCCEDSWSKCPVKRKERSKILKGRISPMKGKRHKEETKRKIGESKIGKSRDENTKRKLSEFRKGKTYEEIYGAEEALRLKEKKREYLNNNQDIKYYNKGKTYVEIMGEEKSKFHINRLKQQIGEKNPFFGKKHTEETINKIKDKWTEDRKNEAREKMIGGHAKYVASFIDREKQLEKLREWMKNGHAAYMNRFIRNPSKPQVELYKMILKFCPYAIMNYPCLNYSIDIAIPFLNIAIEYDEPYWHKNKEYDKKRQCDLEKEGWIFFRFQTMPQESEICFLLKKVY